MLKLRSIILATALAGEVALIGSAATLASTDGTLVTHPGHGSPSEDQTQLWLSGPFGRVPGGHPDDPAAAPPLGLPLDTFTRDAPLLIDAGEAVSPLGMLTVTATPVGGDGITETLSSGELAFEGPSTSGQSVIMATLSLDGDARQSHAWLVTVPDRALPEDGLFDIPAPEVLLASTAGEVGGVAGDGCFAYLCVEIGRPPPPETLEPLSIAVGETPMVRLGDRSAVAQWEGHLSPIDGDGEARVATGDAGDPITGRVELPGLEPPTAGEWLLDLEVVLDRERGWLRLAYRLVVD